MGLFDSLLGKKTFCSVCGTPIPNAAMFDTNGDPLCSEQCRDALERLSQTSTRTIAPGKPDRDVTVAPVDVFGHPEVTVYVFRSNDPSPFYSLQEKIIESSCEPSLRVTRLDGPDVSLVAVAGPLGSLTAYRKVMRSRLGPLAKEARVRPERIRPDATYTNVSESGTLRTNDASILAVCDKIQRGIFRPVFTGPPSVPPSSSAPVLRAMTDEVLMDHATALMEQHIAFFPGGVLKVESDGVCEAGLLFGELARRRPDDPEPAYLEASAFHLGMRHDVAEERLEVLLRKFPDHLESRLLATSGKCVFAYPPYEVGSPIPGSLRDKVRDVTVAMTRKGRTAQPVMFIELKGQPAPTDRNPIALPFYVTAKGVPILGVAAVFAGSIERRYEAIVAGFEDHDGRSCVAPRASYLFRMPRLPIVLHEDGSPILSVEAKFDEKALRAFKECETEFRSMEPRAFGITELSEALEEYHRIHA